jgi:conjugative transfer signal peptidase TraF
MSRTLLALAIPSIVALTLTLTPGRDPTVVWNATASVPIGLYRVVAGQPQRGSIVVTRLPQPLRTFAHARAYLPASVFLIKPIAALRGDLLCRHGSVVSINGRVVAFARKLDNAGRPLPRWRGCRRLSATRIAVVANRPDSFDSRYFGPVDTDNIIGLAIPFWTIGHFTPALQR